MGVPRLIREELLIFLSFTGGEGKSPVWWTGDRGLVSSLTQRDSSGRGEGGERVLEGGGEKKR